MNRSQPDGGLNRLHTWNKWFEKLAVIIRQYIQRSSFFTEAIEVFHRKHHVQKDFRSTVLLHEAFITVTW